MPLDYLDAYRRHLSDADRLFDDQRFPNADHLYGLSAECGLKAIMLKFGMPMNNDMPDKKADMKHANVIWMRYESYRCGFDAAGKYALSANPFSDWSITQRYDHRADFDETRTRPHKAGAEVVANLVRMVDTDMGLP